MDLERRAQEVLDLIECEPFVVTSQAIAAMRKLVRACAIVDVSVNHDIAGQIEDKFKEERL